MCLEAEERECECERECVCVSGRNVLGTSSTWLCNVYLDFTGILSAVDVVKGLFDGLPESNHAVIPQHQNLERAHRKSHCKHQKSPITERHYRSISLTCIK